MFIKFSSSILYCSRTPQEINECGNLWNSTFFVGSTREIFMTTKLTPTSTCKKQVDKKCSISHRVVQKWSIAIQFSSVVVGGSHRSPVRGSLFLWQKYKILFSFIFFFSSFSSTFHLHLSEIEMKTVKHNKKKMSMTKKLKSFGGNFEI